MKNLLFLLLAVTLVACSSSKDDPDPNAPTTFTIMQNEIDIQNNVVVGYYTSEGLCKKLSSLGDLKKGIPSQEITVTIDTLRNLYVFSDYPSPSFKLDTVFVIKPHTRNSFQCRRYTGGIEIDRDDPTQYPH